MIELVSIIVPVYNVEKYLDRCINSILKQTYTNLEIILVNDGSKDNSGKICDRYEKIDNRITVIHKENSGLSSARNTGIDFARGNWISFIDSDDYVSEDYIEKLMQLAIEHNADISICDPVHVFGENEASFIFSKETKEMLPDEAICEMWYQTSFLPSAWGKLFKKNTIDNVRFTEGVVFEDIDIMHEFFSRAKRIVYSPSKLYAYVHRENSITTQRFSDRDLYIITVCEKLRIFASSHSKELMKAAVAYSVVGSLRVLLNSPRIKKYNSYIDNAREYVMNNKKEVFSNPKVRMKTKAGIILFGTNEKLFILIHSKINRWK